MEVLLMVLGFNVFLIRFFKELGKSFPIFELVMVLYFLQYGLAAWLSYTIDPFNTMSVPEKTYLSFATWSCLFFASGLFLRSNKLKMNSVTIDPDLASLLGRGLLIMALLGTIGALVLPYSLRAIINFFIILKFPGTYCLIFSKQKLDRYIVFGIIVLSAVSAILDAALIQFVVFMLFFVMFYSFNHKITKKMKFSIAVFGFAFLSVYQSVKLEYRSLIWEEDKSWQSDVSWQERVAILSDLISIDSFFAAFETDISSNESVIQTVHRLNQGWQTSMVLSHVPRNVPFEKGSALKVDLLSSVMPRFLLPGKRVVNDPDRFNYYTGYILNDQTSMSIGVLGDFYINFGIKGTYVCMFVFGFLMARFLGWFYKKFVYNNPINLIWLPFIFSYFIRPGNEFYMVFNHMVKALIVFLIVKSVLYPYIHRQLLKKHQLFEGN